MKHEDFLGCVMSFIMLALLFFFTLFFAGEGAL